MRLSERPPPGSEIVLPIAISLSSRLVIAGSSFAGASLRNSMKTLRPSVRMPPAVTCITTDKIGLAFDTIYDAGNQAAVAARGVQSVSVRTRGWRTIKKRLVRHVLEIERCRL
jgi:hypothetical protein